MNEALWEKFWEWLADHEDVSDVDYIDEGFFHMGSWLRAKMAEWEDLLGVLEIDELNYGN
jgi:hypothetical protein